MIKNTWPNAGTPAPGLAAAAADLVAGVAGLAATATGALRPAASASTGTSIRPILVRTGHPCLPRSERATQCCVRASMSDIARQVEAEYQVPIRHLPMD